MTDCQVAAGLAFSHRSGQPGGQSHPMWPGLSVLSEGVRSCAGILALSHLRQACQEGVDETFVLYAGPKSGR